MNLEPEYVIPTPQEAANVIANVEREIKIGSTTNYVIGLLAREHLRDLLVYADVIPLTPEQVQRVRRARWDIDLRDVAKGYAIPKD